MATKKSTKFVDEQTTAQDFQWPEHVTEVPDEAWEYLSETELRVFLAMLGTNVERQPRNKLDVIQALSNTIPDDTVHAQAAYRVVCHHELPKGEAFRKSGPFAAPDFLSEVTKLIDRVKTDLGKDAITDIVNANLATAQEAINKHIETALRTHRELKIVVNNEKPTKVAGKTHEKFELAVHMVSQGFPILLVGPTQCGKTTMARQIATALKLPFAAQSFSGGLTESKLLGRVLPKDKGAAEFVGTPFLDVYENGGLFLADEIDAADSNVLTSLNMGIANGEIWLPDRDKKPVAKRHAKNRLVAAANTFGFGADARYVGRNALDYATLERFGCGVIYMDYDRNIEAELARTEILEWAWHLRDLIRKSQLNREMSTRTIVVLEHMTKSLGWGQEEWEERFFANWSNEERRLLGKSNAPSGFGTGSGGSY